VTKDTEAVGKPSERSGEAVGKPDGAVGKPGERSGEVVGKPDGAVGKPGEDVSNLPENAGMTEPPESESLEQELFDNNQPVEKSWAEMADDYDEFQEIKKDILRQGLGSCPPWLTQMLVSWSAGVNHVPQAVDFCIGGLGHVVARVHTPV
jgi:hypothetical protein